MARGTGDAKAVATAQQAEHRGEGMPVRCPCHKLACVVEGDEVAIKCARCKRMIRIRTRGIVDVRVVELPVHEAAGGSGAETVAEGYPGAGFQQGP